MNMRNFKSTCIFSTSMLMLALGVSSAVQAETTKIWVFTNGPLNPPEIPKTEITVLNVREGDALNEQAPRFVFNPNDPNGHVAAQNKVIEWAKSPEGRAHHERLRAAWRSVESLYKCGIQKLPAVVFEGCSYVVYGTQDVAKALQDFDDYKRRNRATR